MISLDDQRPGPLCPERLNLARHVLWSNGAPDDKIALALLTLYKGGGHWTGNGWRWPLATLGFAIPALGLSLYLHYGYSVDLNGMVSESVYPDELFRFLPIYTMFAGAIGFAIGWIGALARSLSSRGRAINRLASATGRRPSSP